MTEANARQCASEVLSTLVTKGHVGFLTPEWYSRNIPHLLRSHIR